MKAQPPRKEWDWDNKDDFFAKEMMMMMMAMDLIASFFYSYY
jgi:hypothetical protein